jgi:predicted metal-dependent HD superfamily phosphohydrolase
VSLYIDLTKTHKIPEEHSADTDLAYFLDFDLAILGKPQVAYDTYATQIRQEYIHVPDDKFKIGRPAVLKQLMEGELYFTEEFITNLDERARANIRREIETLSS